MGLASLSAFCASARNGKVTIKMQKAARTSRRGRFIMPPQGPVTATKWDKTLRPHTLTRHNLKGKDEFLLHRSHFTAVDSLHLLGRTMENASEVRRTQIARRAEN